MPTTNQETNMATPATITAAVAADLADGIVASYAATDPARYYSPDLAAQALADMQAAAATVRRCAARMHTCNPRSRFAYVSQITKAERKLRHAEHTLQGLGRRP